jgi:hypothetical protein
MVHLGDVGQVEPIWVHLEIVSAWAEDSYRICAEHTISSQIILDTLDGTHRWCGWNLVLVRLKIVLILVQDRYMVCAEWTTSMEIILGTPDRLLGDVGQVKSCFGLFRDSVNLSARLGMVCAECTTSVEIILGTPDGTPWWHGSSGSSFRSIWRLC